MHLQGARRDGVNERRAAVLLGTCLCWRCMQGQARTEQKARSHTPLHCQAPTTNHPHCRDSRTSEQHPGTLSPACAMLKQVKAALFLECLAVLTLLVRPCCSAACLSAWLPMPRVRLGSPWSAALVQDTSTLLSCRCMFVLSACLGPGHLHHVVLLDRLPGPYSKAILDCRKQALPASWEGNPPHTCTTAESEV